MERKSKNYLNGCNDNYSFFLPKTHRYAFQRRFYSNLGMTNQTVKAAQEAVVMAEQFDIRCIYLLNSFLVLVH